MTLSACRACGAATTSKARNCPVCGIERPVRVRIGCGGCLMMALLPLALFLGILVLLPLLAGSGLHAQELSLTGEWEFTVESPNGTGTRQVNLIQRGDSLSGTITSSRASGPISGWIKADTVTILAELAMESGPFTVVYEGTVRGDTMMGIVDLGNYGAGTFTGRRLGGEVSAPETTRVPHATGNDRVTSAPSPSGRFFSSMSPPKLSMILRANGIPRPKALSVVV